MKHGKRGRKFGRKRAGRRALLKNLAANLILKEKIKTTEAKAREIRPLVEKLITKSKKQNLALIRYLAEHLPVKARKKIMDLGKRYQERPGGYLRIIKLGPRKRDAAKMAIIEFV